MGAELFESTFDSSNALRGGCETHSIVILERSLTPKRFDG